MNAKKTGRIKTTVENALKAKAFTTGTKALEDGYNLDMALVMAEFEGDQDAIEELESVIRDEPQYFDIKENPLGATSRIPRV